ncbi:type II secretion system F family protein [Candidatus Saccharibacteria bacterium]|nr:type II secretion system F family protein [Candidatus Saccharibacteria bacterium]
MRKYHYEAREQATNKIVKSIVQAESEHAAAKVLIQQGFTPINIKSADGDQGIFGKLTSHISSKDKVIFLRQLATLIGAGLPLSQSLRTVTEQTENKKLQEIIQDIVTEVEGGKSLSSAFKRYPEVFDTIVIALVTAGETSGTLDEALKRVALQKEKDAETISKIRGAMVYPSIVMLVIVGVMVFMLVSVVPQVEDLYDNLGQSLPWLTEMLIGASNIIMNFWWLIFIILGLIGYFTAQYLKTDSGIHVKDTFKLNVPLFNSLFRKMYMARFTRTGQTLLATGVAMLDMLRISADSVNNVIIAEEINRAAEKVKGGKELSFALEKEEYILTMVPQMIKIGEQAGKIDEMMGKTAQVYEDELESEIKGLTTTIEPLLMVVMAVAVGGMVGAILFPIYSLVNKIH